MVPSMCAVLERTDVISMAAGAAQYRGDRYATLVTKLTCALFEMNHGTQIVSNCGAS